MATLLSTTFVLGVPQRYDELVNPCDPYCGDRQLGQLDLGQQERLAEIGIDARMYAWWDIGREAALAVAAIVLGTILIRRIATFVAFLTATVMVAFGAVLVPETGIAGERAAAMPGWLHQATWVVAMVTIAVPWYLLPTGRFVPRWAWAPATATTASWVALSFTPHGDDPPVALEFSAVGLLLFGIGAQVHRFRQASDDLDRQQLKWLGIGLVGWFGALLSYYLYVEAALLDPTADGVSYPLTYLAFGVTTTSLAAIFPFSWAVAILQYRLWDADRVLSRGALAATASAAVVVAYVATAFVVAGVAGGQSDIAGPLAAAVLVGLVLVMRDPLTRRVTRLFYGQRDAPYELLSSLWAVANENRPDVATLTVLARRLVESLHLTAGRVTVVGDSGVVVDRTIGEPTGQATTIPLASGGERVGDLTVWPRRGEATLPARDVRLIANASAPIAHLAATVRLTGDLRRSQANLVDAREEERRRIHRNLHDDLGPTLAGQALLLDAADNTLDFDPGQAREFVGMARRRADELVEHIRTMARDLRPSALDQLGLTPALRQAVSAAASGDVHVDADIDELTDLTAATETAAYRIITEALTNAIRHSDAGTISVRVQAVGSGLRATIADDGRGGTPSTTNGDGRGVGLQSMHLRARELGGRVTIASPAGGGTTVELVLPGAADG
ncbi:MAG: sensor histidine kinase [Ilumatobacter sp.]|nr:sensor histidine kinase [Ilumatobacter sp.]